MTDLAFLGWALLLSLPSLLILRIEKRIMAKLTDVNASITKLETDLSQLMPGTPNVPNVPPAATEADLELVKQRIDAADATVQGLLAAQNAS